MPVFQSLGLYNISDGAIDSIIEKYMIKYEINGERGVTVICNTKVNVLVWSLFWLILLEIVNVTCKVLKYKVCRNNIFNFQRRNNFHSLVFTYMKTLNLLLLLLPCSFKYSFLFRKQNQKFALLGSGIIYFCFYIEKIFWEELMFIESKCSLSLKLESRRNTHRKLYL